MTMLVVFLGIAIFAVLATWLTTPRCYLDGSEPWPPSPRRRHTD